MNEQPRIVRGMRLKVLIGFSAVLLAVALAGVINFISLNRLIESVKILSGPDEKFNYSRQLLVHLTNEEAAVRTFTLTKDNHDLDAYYQLSDSVHLAVTHLKMLTYENDGQAALTDSIQRLVAEREGLLNHFIAASKANFETQFNKSSVAGKKLQSLSFLSEKSSVKQNQNKTTSALKKDSVSETKKSKGFLGLFKGNSKDKKKDNTENGNIAAKDSSLIKNKSASNTDAIAMAKMNALIDSEEAALTRQMQQWSADVP